MTNMIIQNAIISTTREHEICMGHRVYGHESKCSNLHGHNYRFVFTVKAKQGLDSVGRVTDFSEIKTVLCEWLEENWDHKTMLWKEDPILTDFEYVKQSGGSDIHGIVPVPFNPTAENIAEYFLNTIAPMLTDDRNWYLNSLKLFETSKCSVDVSLTKEMKEREIGFRKLVSIPDGYFCSRQCGTDRNCKCEGLTNKEKLNCLFCTQDLPF